jgi:hypothetical protein
VRIYVRAGESREFYRNLVGKICVTNTAMTERKSSWEYNASFKDARGFSFFFPVKKKSESKSKTEAKTTLSYYNF